MWRTLTSIFRPHSLQRTALDYLIGMRRLSYSSYSHTARSIKSTSYVSPNGKIHSQSSVSNCWQQQVISELDQPRKTFPRASFHGVLIVAIMFTAVNFTYVGDWSVFLDKFFQAKKSTQAAIIPKQELFSPAIDVGTRFIQYTLGHAGLSANQLNTLWSTLKAISALGNLIVVTFTAARGNVIEAYPQTGS